MMLRAYKYPIRAEDYFDIRLPEGAQILAIQMQRGNPQMWALVDPDAPLESRRFRLAGTGHLIVETQDDLTYIDTFQLYNGDLVFHLFEVKAEA